MTALTGTFAHEDTHQLRDYDRMPVRKNNWCCRSEPKIEGSLSAELAVGTIDCCAPAPTLFEKLHRC
jgi:hypothetical protein